jgi:import inner membrane translocase subunit TIM10
MEAEILTDLFTKMSTMCHKKCVVRNIGEGDLSVGEMACTDRCVGKYMQAQEKIGQVLNSHEQQMKQQELIQKQTEKTFGVTK